LLLFTDVSDHERRTKKKEKREEKVVACGRTERIRMNKPSLKKKENR